MARRTRQQRRDRRRQQEGDAASTSVSQRARARQQAVRPSAQPVKSQGGRGVDARRGSFVAESWGELKKVEWPGQKQVTQGTIVVIIACAIVGAYLYAADLVFKNLVEYIL